MDSYAIDPVIDLATLTADEFPGAAQSTYLSSCTRGLLPMSARRAVDAHLDDLALGRTDKSALFDLIEETRRLFAALINATPGEIAMTKNVSEGLNILAASLDWQAGDNVVVTLDLEHPNNVYPWLNQEARHGIKVRAIPDRDGHIDIEAMIAAMDDRTRLVTLPTVTFSPGFRSDVRHLGEICRKRGVFLLVDAVQSVGVLHTDVNALGVDGLATSTQKGLCGLYGMGFLYCRNAWAERITPVYLARFGVDLGEGAHEAAMGATNYRLMAGAKRFDVGNYNYPAAAACLESMKILTSVGTKRIEAHVTQLSHRLVTELLDLGLPVAGGEPGPHLGSIVCIGKPGGGHDSTDDPEIEDLSKHLFENGVIHTIRRGMIRFALHVYNNVDDVGRVIELTRGWRTSH